MIDIEVDVINIVKNAVDGVMGKGVVDVSATYTKDPAHFPFVSVVETDNSVVDQYRTTDHVENFASVTYDINMYSNRMHAKKAECKAMAAAIDEVMLKHGFSRLSLIPTPNVLDATVYRMTGRYRAMVDAHKRIYARR